VEAKGCAEPRRQPRLPPTRACSFVSWVGTRALLDQDDSQAGRLSPLPGPLERQPQGLLVQPTSIVAKTSRDKPTPRLA